MPHLRPVMFIVLSTSLLALAQTPPKRKSPPPKLDLGMPAFREIPKDQKLETNTGEPSPQLSPSAPRGELGYSVVRVVHGKSLSVGPDGAKAAAPFPHATVQGTPLASERFSSVVRVKSPAKRNTRIEVRIVDARGDVLMEAAGELRFGKTDEAEWQVDWEPTTVRAPGQFQVQVRVGGTDLGGFPLEFVRPAN